MTDEETIFAKDQGDLYIINSDKEANEDKIVYNSDQAEKLSKEEIKDIIREFCS